MSLARLLIVSVIMLVSQHCEAQTDSTVQSLQHLSTKYITTVDNKIEKYSHRLSSKTEKTLAKLSRWENKIHSLLQKVNPEAAQKLFGEGQTTFSSLLQKLKEGKNIAEQYKAKYDEYRDKLTTNLNYLQQQKEKLDTKLVKPVQEATKKATELEQDVQNSEALEQFIKERKKQLLDESLKYIGKSKYLTKINKEAYYYVETLRNYKAIFSDKQKAEETALTILNKIPAFQKFVQQNSMLASLFRMPGSGNSNTPNLAGLQTRAQMNSLIQERIAAGGPNAQAQIQQNIQQAQDELNKLKDKVLKNGNSSSDADLPPSGVRGLNMQKIKTFRQRLEFGSNLQFAKNNSLVPTTADIGLSLGYKLNDKSVIGLGASYKMGLGSIQHISITHQGLGLRSFVDWKLKKQFFISGGYEMNWTPGINEVPTPPLGGRGTAWQQAGLIGISKKIAVKTKFFKGTKLQLLYDMLHSQHVPVSQPVLFRIGYDFK